MADHVGAVTPNALMLLADSGVSTERALKEMFIFFEKLVYLPQSGDTEGIDFATELLAVHAATADAERKQLLSHRAFTTAILDAEDVWSRKELTQFIAETLLSRAANQLLDEALEQKLSNLSNDPLPYAEALPEGYRSLRSAYKHMLMSPYERTDIAFAELVRKKFRFGGGMLSKSHQRIMEAFAEMKSGPHLPSPARGGSTPVMPATIVDGFTIPDFGSLSWEEIFELRSDRFVKDFRTKLGETMQLTGTADASNVQLGTQVEAELWRLVEESQPPRLGVRLGKIGLSLLHVPPFEWISPLIHSALGLGELIEDSKRRKAFGWLFFLGNARKTLREYRDS
jgi:hypothetical protein